MQGVQVSIDSVISLVTKIYPRRGEKLIDGGLELAGDTLGKRILGNIHQLSR